MPYESIAHELSRAQVFLDREIGSGEFGEVFSGRVVFKVGENRVKEDKTIAVAIKTLKSTEPDDIVAFKQEIAIVVRLCSLFLSL